MTYPKLPGLTWDGTIYENEEMGDLEALIPNGGFPTAHGPAMVELPDGSLLCCWFAGTYEGDADVHVICSRLPKDGTAWSEPVDISGDPKRSEQNPSLFNGPDGAVWAMYTAQLDRQEGKSNMQFTSVVRCQKSNDGGLTWSEPKPTPLPNNNSSISAIKLASGRLAIAYNPTCTPDPQPGKAAWPGLRCPVAVALSEDGGLTFPIIRWMERGEGYIGDENKTNNKQYEYPFIMQTKDGNIHLAYAARTRQGVKYVRFTEADILGEKRERVGLYDPTAAKFR